MTVSSAELDLDKCAQEPIHVPGGIQPHGALVVVDPDSFEVIQASANLGALLDIEPVAGNALRVERFGGSLERDLRDWLDRGRLNAGEPAFMRTAQVGTHKMQVQGHRTRQGLILEFEAAPASESETLEALYPHIVAFIEVAQGATNLVDLCQATAREFRKLTRFNRVLIYRFDRDWHGEVIAEDGDGELPSYLGLRFPASDIPAQARELYRLNRMRLIPDANYRRVSLSPPLCPTDGAPLDLTHSALRSVSPVHLEYMRNMGTLASMSISILIDGALWGLISCHNAAARHVNPQVRTACDLLGKVVSLQIGSLERGAYATRRIQLKQMEAMLLARLGEAESLKVGLAQNAEQWMQLGGATGVAVADETSVLTAGLAPPVEDIQVLVARLREMPGEHFVTDSLAARWPEFAAVADVASGVLAISISQLHPRYILWFRPEVVRTVRWGGDPTKSADAAGNLHPRHSFEAWKEHVTQRAQPWIAADVDGLLDFRNSIINVVLRRAEERAELTTQLQRSNKELESFSYSVSHDLRAPFRHIVGYTQLLRDRETSLSDKSQHYLDSINEAAASAGQLVDDLLSFSQLGRASLSRTRFDVRKAVQEVRKMLEPDTAGRHIEWRVADLPPAWGDVSLLRQVLVNLLHNAVKYTRGREPAIIEVRGEQRAEECVYTVKDNGVGFEMAYVDKLFGVFQRLHRMEDYEGTGIGLALTKRIIERHGGWIRAQGVPDAGATFEFGIPNA